MAERKSCLSEQMLSKTWTVEELETMIKNEDVFKLSDVFQVHPDLINLKQAEKEESEPFNLLHYKTLVETVCKSIGGRAEAVPDIFKLFLSKKNIYLPINYLNKFLIKEICWSLNLLDVLKIIIENNPMYIHQEYNKGKSLLHYLCKKGPDEAVAFVLQQPDIHVNTTDLRGRTPLILAAEYSNTGIIKLLGKYPGIEPNITDISGETALHKACQSNEATETVSSLLEIPGINVDIVNRYGKTASACSYSEDAVRLISMHTEKKVASQESKDPQNDKKKSFADIPTEDHQAKKWTFMELFQMLVQKDFENLQQIFQWQPYTVNQLDNKGRTMLHLAVMQGYPLELVQFLLRNDANCRIADKIGGNMVAHYAAFKNKQYMEALLKQDPDLLNICNENWDTPLHFICSLKLPPTDLLFLIFQRPNIKLNEMNKHGRKPDEVLKDYLGEYEEENECVKSMVKLFKLYREYGIVTDASDYDKKCKEAEEEARRKREISQIEETELDGGVIEKKFLISLAKKDGKLGFTIPQIPNGIYVKSVNEEGAAATKLQEGDRIIEVNNINFEKTSYEEAMKILSDNDQFQMTIIRRYNKDGSVVLPW